jgi:hypothetical protein
LRKGEIFSVDIEKFFGILREKQLKQSKESPAFWSIPYWPDTFRDVLTQIMPQPIKTQVLQVPEKTQALMGLYQLAKKEAEMPSNEKNEIKTPVSIGLIDQIRVQTNIVGNNLKWPEQVFLLTDQGWSPCLESNIEEKFDVAFIGMELGQLTMPAGQAWDLLAKMARAMAPKVKRVLAICAEVDWNTQQYVLLRSRAAYVVGLGSKSCSLALQKSIKLNDAHGKFYDLIFNYQNQSVSSTFVPVFHPEFLSSTPNMKRVAWEDLQKIISVI